MQRPGMRVAATRGRPCSIRERGSPPRLIGSGRGMLTSGEGAAGCAAPGPEVPCLAGFDQGPPSRWSRLCKARAGEGGAAGSELWREEVGPAVLSGAAAAPRRIRAGEGADQASCVVGGPRQPVTQHRGRRVATTHRWIRADEGGGRASSATGGRRHEVPAMQRPGTRVAATPHRIRPGDVGVWGGRGRYAGARGVAPR